MMMASDLDRLALLIGLEPLVLPILEVFFLGFHRELLLIRHTLL